jgi:hypothetical protein
MQQEVNSFPFFRIARKFDIPYRSVLAVVEMHKEFRRCNPGIYWPPLNDYDTISTAIYSAYVNELDRRE